VGKRPVPKQLTPFKKGKSGNPAGKPKGTIEFARRMRDAFNVPDPMYKRSLTDVVLRYAFDDKSPKQTWAIQFCAAYGIGLPKRALDDESVKALAKEMMEAALEEARKRKEAEVAQLTATATANNES